MAAINNGESKFDARAKLNRNMAAVVNVFDYIPSNQHAAILSGSSSYDAQPDIQRAVDDAAYRGFRSSVFLPSGKYLTDETIHLGYGDNAISQIVFESFCYQYNSADFTGATINPQRSDRPAIAVQGARGTVIRGISLWGLLFPLIANNNFAYNTIPLLDDLDPDNWNDATLAATQDSRYAPYAAIAIDPYSGVRPGTSYPDVDYPVDLLPGAVQWGKGTSSDVLIEDCLIEGFTVGVACMPSDADGGGDFHQLRRSHINKCKWGLSVGNTQSRNVSLRDVKMAQIYCALTTTKHGMQSGQLGGAITNLSLGGAIELLDVGASITGPVVFTSLYGESIWQIGEINSSSASNKGFIFHGCHIGFHGQIPERGYPAKIIESAGNITPIAFHECTFDHFKSVAGFDNSGVTFDGCDFEPAPGARTDDYEKFAHNLLCGGLTTLRLDRPDRSRVKSRHYDLDLGTELTNQLTTVVGYGTRNSCIPIYAEAVRATNERGDRMASPRITSEAIDKATLAACTLTGRVLSMTFASRSNEVFAQHGPLPGDVLWDDETGSVFFVSARTALVVTAILQNNYRDISGTISILNSFSTSSGNLYVANSRVYTPIWVLRGDLTAASAVITNCARDDGFAAWFDAQIAVGDSFLVRDTLDNFVAADAAVISARDQSAGTITLTSSSGVRTQVRRRLDYFVRTPPANV